MTSGPKRFEYDFDKNKWMEVSELDGVKNCNRQENDINSLLANEMKQLYGVDMKFLFLYSNIIHSCQRSFMVNTHYKCLLADHLQKFYLGKIFVSKSIYLTKIHLAKY